MSTIDDLFERDQRARQMLVERADVTVADLAHTSRTLGKIARIQLDDLLVPPAFDLLPDGSVGAANTDTRQWKQWAAISDLVDAARRLEHHLATALLELVPEPDDKSRQRR